MTARQEKNYTGELEQREHEHWPCLTWKKGNIKTQSCQAVHSPQWQNRWDTFLRDYGAYGHNCITQLLQICQLHVHDANLLLQRMLKLLYCAEKPVTIEATGVQRAHCSRLSVRWSELCDIQHYLSQKKEITRYNSLNTLRPWQGWKWKHFTDSSLKNCYTVAYIYVLLAFLLKSVIIS